MRKRLAGKQCKLVQVCEFYEAAAWPVLAKCLLVTFPQTPKIVSFTHGCASQRTLITASGETLLPRFFPAGSIVPPVDFKKVLHIGFDIIELFHFLAGLLVSGISCSLLREKSGIFLTE